jgi:hypothetical protein
MATAASAELPEFEAFRRRLLILRRHVVAVFALGTLQRYVVAWHNSPSKTFKYSDIGGPQIYCRPLALTN